MGHILLFVGIFLLLLLSIFLFHKIWQLEKKTIRNDKSDETSDSEAIPENLPEALTEEDLPKTSEKKNLLPLLLIVDNDEDTRNYIADSFTNSFHISQASTGQAGVSLAIETIPDIIICENMSFDGNILCKALKEDVRTSHIPIILLTEKNTEADRAEGYAMGVDSYLTKPFTINVLRSRIDNLLEGRKRMLSYLSTKNYKKDFVSNAAVKFDNDFIEKTISLIEENMESVQISITFLSEQQNMSYSTFSKKIKSITGLSANEFVRKIKMRHAEHLLLSRKYSISEIAYRTGFNSMAHFREAFKAEFGVLPSKYISKIEE